MADQLKARYEIVELKMAEAPQPSYKEKKGAGGGYIEFGDKNDYPDYLVELLNKSSKHNAIVKSKVNYITGQGFRVTGGQDPVAERFINQINRYESSREVLTKVSFDIENGGGAYLECIWSESGETLAEVYHVPYGEIRTNEDNTQFWHCENWQDRKAKRTPMNAFNPQLRVGKQILFLKEYRPNCGAYPLPSWFGALNYIEADIEISKHVLGNAQTGFSASKLITLPNGEPNPEEKREIERKFTNRFTGSDGKKFILSFVADPSRKPIIDDLGASDITKEDFQNVDKLIEKNLFAGHQVTSPDLFGISTPGSLGSRQQMRDSYEIFKNTYVNDKQLFLNQVFNQLAKLSGASEQIEIAPVEPIGIEFSEAIIAQNLTKDEIREKIGAEKLEAPTSSTSQDVLDALNSLSPLVANKVLESMTANEIRAIVGLSAEAEGDQIPTAPEVPQAQGFSDHDIIGMFEEIGESKQNYTILRSREVFSDQVDPEEEMISLEFAEAKLSKLELQILDLIKKNKLISPLEIAGVLNEDLGVVRDIVKNFVSKGIISQRESKGKIESTLPKPISEITDQKPQTTIEMRYSYEWRSGFDNSDLATSRDFCRRLIALDKLYTRAEIEQISARLGYSVFDRRGGWWTMPNGVHSPSCRHRWFSQAVIKKG